MSWIKVPRRSDGRDVYVHSINIEAVEPMEDNFVGATLFLTGGTFLAVCLAPEQVLALIGATLILGFMCCSCGAYLPKTGVYTERTDIGRSQIEDSLPGVPEGF